MVTWRFVPVRVPLRLLMGRQFFPCGLYLIIVPSRCHPRRTTHKRSWLFSRCCWLRTRQEGTPSSLWERLEDYFPLFGAPFDRKRPPGSQRLKRGGLGSMMRVTTSCQVNACTCFPVDKSLVMVVRPVRSYSSDSSAVRCGVGAKRRGMSVGRAGQHDDHLLHTTYLTPPTLHASFHGEGAADALLAVTW